MSKWKTTACRRFADGHLLGRIIYVKKLWSLCFYKMCQEIPRGYSRKILSKYTVSNEKTEIELGEMHSHTLMSPFISKTVTYRKNYWHNTESSH